MYIKYGADGIGIAAKTDHDILLSALACRQ